MKQSEYQRLIISLKLFLFVEAYAPREMSKDQPLCEISITRGEKLQPELIKVAVKKWQAHHGYDIEEEGIVDKTVSEIVTNALSHPQLEGQEYSKFAYQKMEEAYDILNEYLEASNNEFEKNEYLSNLN